MRIACALITHLRAKAELRRHARLRSMSLEKAGNAPIIVVDKTKGKPLVVDSSAGTSVRAGMTLEQAMSCRNDVIILDADQSCYRSMFEGVLRALLRVSDRVEAAELGVAYARVDGLERLYGGECEVAAALLAAVPDYLRARIGVGDTKFAAYIAARTAPTSGITACPDDAAGFLASMSIDLLPLFEELKRPPQAFRRSQGGFRFQLHPRDLTGKPDLKLTRHCLKYLGCVDN